MNVNDDEVILTYNLKAICLFSMTAGFERNLRKKSFCFDEFASHACQLVFKDCWFDKLKLTAFSLMHQEKLTTGLLATLYIKVQLYPHFIEEGQASRRTLEN